MYASRVSSIQESETLKLNSQVIELIRSGQKIINLTAGQLTQSPPEEFIASIRREAGMLKSYQYSPVAGYSEVREKIRDQMIHSRELDHIQDSLGVEVIISNGAKQVLFNALGVLLEKNQKAMLLAPYWGSYLEMIRFWGADAVIVNSTQSENYHPDLNAIEDAFKKEKIRCVVLNSPNNPSGIHYNPVWMEGFAQILKKYPDVFIISDEIYREIYYFDPRPTYFYQFDNQLLSRTLIVDGISKSFASTGLRLGFGLAPKKFIQALNLIQSQSTSNASSLIQMAVMNVGQQTTHHFLNHLREHLRQNAHFTQKTLRDSAVSPMWYQTYSAFYYLFDVSLISKLKGVTAEQIAQTILNELQVAVVPGTTFGLPHHLRMSMVASKTDFEEGVAKLVNWFALKA